MRLILALLIVLGIESSAFSQMTVIHHRQVIHVYGASAKQSRKTAHLQKRLNKLTSKISRIQGNGQ